jgi:DNA topoisomerase I
LGPDGEKGGEKPKRASIPKGWSVEDIDLAAALRLLSLPREIGMHPESGKPIVAGIGRYGPFVEHDGKYANLESVDEVFTVGNNRAISLLAEKKSGGRRQGASVIKALGEHSTLGGAVTVRSGRYGPYVNHGKLNATLPRNLDPENVTLDLAVGLLAEKELKSGSGRPAARKRSARPASKSGAKRKPKAGPKVQAAE